MATPPPRGPRPLSPRSLLSPPAPPAVAPGQSVANKVRPSLCHPEPRQRLRRQDEYGRPADPSRHRCQQTPEPPLPEGPSPVLAHSGSPCADPGDCSGSRTRLLTGNHTPPQAREPQPLSASRQQPPSQLVDQKATLRYKPWPCLVSFPQALSNS